ncbi:MAG: hypothetical protein KAX09_07485 [Candidatus Heimdallarchaeota archaeon]|nr:hypothetical protein [Candidatus Heimdallarchaeota archaeon]MCK4290810.1 hypothetical protein [Candidatus Heimdallarchaeota archaeon]
MKERTQLEIACAEIVGDETNQYYDILSEMLIMNPHLLKKDDTRLSAQFTSILFSEEVEDKAHLICSIIETIDNKSEDKYVKQAKLLLEIDPVLEITKQIVDKLKTFPNPNYSEIMRKVNIHKDEVRIIRRGFVYHKRRV